MVALPRGDPIMSGTSLVGWGVDKFTIERLLGGEAWWEEAGTRGMPLLPGCHRVRAFLLPCLPATRLTAMALLTKQ